MSNTAQKAFYEAAENIARIEREVRNAISGGTLNKFMAEKKNDLVSSLIAAYTGWANELYSFKLLDL